ncbi:M16 family metallopeptidase [Flagellimonas onchidii]|uniref:M16 family metallopeptidase n=1 Tax=Flagellimonas onchidii TaxID=2562684 RepID=UPI0010A6748E|nr:M16 family metallopeptidase [Allomuricauda onchidii]
MRKIIISGILFLMAFGLEAQSIDYNAPLPVDKSIRKGTLPNGLTYYIKSTDVVKDAASYYIIQNVGSVLENDDQQGLAHFLEHMAFNGTQSFPGKGILNTLQKHGAVFGKDINAYTSFDETVYNLNNIPTKDGLVDTCLTVLHDWCNYLLLTDEEIDAERGVIKEEWRTRQNGQMRLFQTSLPITFNHSKYADRLPIGLMSIVENFEYKALRDFYHDWYRTDLQAIAVIGDIDVDEIEKKIKDKFLHIPAVENPRERFVVAVPENEELLYSLGMDPEVSTSNIDFGIRHKKLLKDQTVADLKQSLLENMVSFMLSTRVSDKAQKPEASYLGSQIVYQSMARANNVFGIKIFPKPEKQQAALKEVLTEVQRAVRFGFTQSEIERIIKEFSNFYETQISKKDDQPHGAIIRPIQSNYLRNETITDLEKEYGLAKQVFATLSAKELHNVIKRLYTKKNRYINVTGVKGKNNLTEQQAKEILVSVENDASIEPYNDASSGKTLISGLDIKKGSFKEIIGNNNLDAVTYTFNNGVKVHYKFTDKEKNKVDLKAISYGGKSLVKDEDLPSADLMRDLILMSGLGDYSATELPKILAGKTARVVPKLDKTTERIEGSSTTKDVETMLQMVYLYFEKPRFDKQSFQVMQSGINQYLIKRSKDVKEQIKDGITTTLYGENHPRKRVFDQAYVDDIVFDKIKSVYEDRFENPADFEFYIVGDVKKEQLEPLLVQYVASLPTTDAKESFKDNSANWKSDKVDEDVYLQMEDPKANVNIFLKKKMEYNPKNILITKAFGDILQLRITETVREQEGGAYSPNVWSSLFKEPRTQAYLSVSFDCNPDIVEKLASIVHAEIEKISKGHIKDGDLNKTLTNYLKEREQAKNKNAYAMDLLTTFYRDGYNMDDSENFEDIVNKISKKDIQTLAKEILQQGKSSEIIVKPKNG